MDIYNKRKNLIKNFYKKNKYLPGYNDLAGLFKLSSRGSLHCYMKRFLTEDFLRKTKQGRLIPGDKFFEVPVMGSIQAGFPSAAEEELADVITLDEYLITNSAACYLVQVSGNSMLEAGLIEGDTVIIDRSLTPKNGDIVVAQIDNEWTIKYFIKQGARVILRAANKKYPDIKPQQELKVAGVVVSSFRKYR